ncbi:MAG: helix-turn-helix transcriptional regulator [Porcipelethomonas sp.]
MDRKERILSLLNVIYKYTDDDHQLSTNQLIQILLEQGVSYHRESLTSDIHLLQKAGYDIICVKSTQNKYFVGNRNFDAIEIKMLSDAINAAQFISKEKSKQLINKLFSEMSIYQTEQLKMAIQKPNKNKVTNSSLYSADLINTAVALGRKITFQYYEYDVNMQRVLKHDGYTYTVSPYATVWNNDRYYMIGYCEKHNDIIVFRVDRIVNIALTDSVSIPRPADFDLNDFLSKKFKMFSGEVADVTLMCENKHTKAIADRFGDNLILKKIDSCHFAITVSVELTPTFYAWVFQYQGEIIIQSPQKAVDEFVHMGKSVFEVSG